MKMQDRKKQDHKEIVLRGYVTGSAEDDALLVWARQFPIFGDDTRILLRILSKMHCRWGHDHRHEKVEVTVSIKIVPPTKQARKKP